MNEQEAIQRMVAPGTKRPGKWRGGVIQVWVTRSCDKSCFSCTQGSNLGGKPGAMTPAQFEVAVKSLKGYFGVVGMFGGNPALNKDFKELCAIMREHVPYEQRGLWCNNPITMENAQVMRETFNPAVSNLNVHLDPEAYALFRKGWPEAHPFGLDKDSRHSPPYVSMKDVGVSEEERWGLISKCDINQNWSAMIGVFRGQVRAWFCEIAAAQAMLHQDEPDYPDSGLLVAGCAHADQFAWWSLPMDFFKDQVNQHCHDCGVPLRGHGNLAQAEGGVEQVSAAHEGVYKLKRKGRELQVVTTLDQLHPQDHIVTHYLQTGAKS